MNCLQIRENFKQLPDYVKGPDNVIADKLSRKYMKYIDVPRAGRKSVKAISVGECQHCFTSILSDRLKRVIS